MPCYVSFDNIFSLTVPRTSVSKEICEKSGHSHVNHRSGKYLVSDSASPEV